MKKSLATFALAALVFGANAQEKMTAELLWKLGRVSMQDVSPDGSTLLYSVAHYDAQSNGSSTKLYKVDTKTGVATALPMNIGSPKFLQNGTKIGGVVEEQFALTDLKAESASTIAQLKADSWKAIELADGKLMLPFTKPFKFRKTTADLYPDLPKANAEIVTELNYMHWDHWNDEFVDHLNFAIYDGKAVLEGKDIMGEEAFDASDFTASPDGKHIVYSSKKVRGTAYATSTNTDIYLYEIATGKTTNLTEGMMGYDKQPQFSPNGQQLAWLSMPQDGNEADVNKLWILDFASNTKTQTLTENYVQDFQWITNTSIGFMVPKQATQQIGTFDFGGKKSKETIITNGDYNYGSFAFRGKQLFASRTDMNHAAEIFTVDMKKGSAKQLTHVNDEAYAGITMSKIEKRWIKTTDGKDMLTWVIYPPNFDPTKKYPTLLYCQGGPQSPVSQFYSFRWNFQLMAAHDYIIVAPNRRGLQGFGVEWNEAISKDWGGQPILDYYSAIDEVAKEPFVDTDKLGAVGASYGGYSVFMLAGTHQKRFKAFIAHDGVFNAVSMYGSTEELFFSNWENDGPYWNSPTPKAYTEFSPHTHVKKWDTPILIIQGAKDFRIPYAQAMEAFQAAQLLGVPSKLLFFHDENHWVLKPQNGLVWQAEFYSWLDQWLK